MTATKCTLLGCQHDAIAAERDRYKRQCVVEAGIAVRLDVAYETLVSEHERTERELAAANALVIANDISQYRQQCEQLKAALHSINLIVAHAPPCDELDEDGDTYNSLLDSIQRHCRTPSAPTAPTPYTGSITDSMDSPQPSLETKGDASG